MMKKLLITLLGLLVSGVEGISSNNRKYDEIPERTIMFVIDGLPPLVHERIDLPQLSSLVREGVLYEEVYLPLAAHPEQSDDYPWTCSVPNPSFMAGTVFSIRRLNGH